MRDQENKTGSDSDHSSISYKAPFFDPLGDGESFFALSSGYNVEDYSLEVRLESPQESAFRWMLGLNITGLTEAPKSAIAVGGRFGYDDDGETPNTLLVAYETGSFPLVAQFRALTMRPGLEAMDHYRGIRIGTVIECENGYYAGGRGGGWIYDKDRSWSNSCLMHGSLLMGSIVMNHVCRLSLPPPTVSRQ